MFPSSSYLQMYTQTITVCIIKAIVDLCSSEGYDGGAFFLTISHFFFLALLHNREKMEVITVHH